MDALWLYAILIAIVVGGIVYLIIQPRPRPNPCGAYVLEIVLLEDMMPDEVVYRNRYSSFRAAERAGFALCTRVYNHLSSTRVQGDYPGTFKMGDLRDRLITHEVSAVNNLPYGKIVSIDIYGIKE